MPRADAKGNGPDASDASGYHPVDLTHIGKLGDGKSPRQAIPDGGRKTVRFLSACPVR